MNKSMLAVLNTSERLLVAETDASALAALDEDAAVALQDRIRRARTKYVGLYRRGASARVVEQRGRGKAGPKNTTAAAKAEVFEEALARVSRRVAALARETAAQLRDERLAAARGVRTGRKPAAAPAGGTARKSRTVTDAPAGDRALRSAASEKERAGTKAATARRQAKRDSR